ncbi:MAG: response regulator [bacterium]|nr:response regulator [bacterium]
MFCNRILIVDDESGIREVLKELLERKGYQVLAVANGEDALELMKNVLPQVVILDYLMPGMDGLETLSRIKKEYPEVLVAILTGAGSEYIAVKAMKLGADDYICKPIERDRLYLIVGELVEKFKQSLVWVNHEYEYPLADDIVRKYEFLRKVYSTDKPNIYKICKYFNFFRQDFYILNKKFKQNGIIGIIDKSVNQIEEELGTGEELGINPAKLNSVANEENAEKEESNKRRIYKISDFINRNDPVQMRLEMIREAATTPNPNITMICRKYHVTREAFYQNYRRFEKFGVLGLIDRKRGRPSLNGQKD